MPTDTPESAKASKELILKITTLRFDPSLAKSSTSQNDPLAKSSTSQNDPLAKSSTLRHDPLLIVNVNLHQKQPRSQRMISVGILLIVEPRHPS